MAVKQASVESTPSRLPVCHIHGHLPSSEKPVDKVKVTSGGCHVENIPSKSIGDGERVATDAMAVLQKLNIPEIGRAQGSLGVPL